MVKQLQSLLLLGLISSWYKKRWCQESWAMPWHVMQIWWNWADNGFEFLAKSVVRSHYPVVAWPSPEFLSFCLCHGAGRMLPRRCRSQCTNLHAVALQALHLLQMFLGMQNVCLWACLLTSHFDNNLCVCVCVWMRVPNGVHMTSWHVEPLNW